MNTELLREYRTVQSMEPDQLAQWLENRLCQMGLKVTAGDGSVVSAVLDSGKPGCDTVFRVSVLPQTLEDGSVCHLCGNDAACAMVLYTLRQVALSGTDKGRIQARFLCGTGLEDSQECDTVEIGLAAADEAKLGETVLRCPEVGENGQLKEDCIRAAQSVMRSVRAERGHDVFRILVGANPNPDLGMPGMRFHMLALENGADILSALIRIRHSL